MSTRRTRTIRLILGAALIGLIAMAAVGVWLALSRVVEVAIVAALGEAGIPRPTLKVEEIDLERASIVEVEAGEDRELTIRRIDIAYSIDTLFSGRVHRIEVTGLRMKASLVDGRLSFGSLDPALNSLETTGGTATRPPDLEIHDASVDLAGPWGFAELRADGTIAADAENVTKVQLALSVASDYGQLSGRVDAARAADGRIDGRVMIDRGAASFGDISAANLAGDLRIMLAPDGMPQASGRIELSGITVGDTLLPHGGVRIDLDGDKAKAHADIANADGTIRTVVDVEATGLGARPQVSSTLDLRLPVETIPWPTETVTVPKDGSVKVAARFRGTLPRLLDLEASPNEFGGFIQDLTVETEVDLDLKDFDAIGVARNVSVAGPLKVRVDTDETRFEAPAAISATGSLDPAIRERLGLPGDLQAMIEGPLAVTILPPLTLNVSPEAGGVTFEGDVGLRVTTSQGSVAEGRILGRTTLGGVDVHAFDVASVKLTLQAVSIGQTKLDEMVLEGEFSGSPQDFTGIVRGEMTAPEFEAAGISARGVRVPVDAETAYSGGRLEFKLHKGSRVALQRLRLSPSIAIGKPLNLPIEPAGDPAVVVDFRPDSGPSVAHDLRLGPVQTDARIAVGSGQPESVRISVPSVRLSGSWSAPGGYRGTAGLTGGKLASASFPFSLSGIAGDVSIDDSTGVWDIVIRGADVTSSAEPPIMAPLRLKGSGRLSGDRLRFSADVSGAKRPFSATITGQYRLASGSANARIDVKPIAFKPTGLQPKHIAPILGALIDDADGAVALTGEVSWSRGQLASNLSLLIRDLSMRTTQVDIARLNGVIAIDGLDPLSTPPRQQLAVAAVNAGLPLTNGLATIRMLPGHRLQVDSLQLKLAGGLVTLEQTILDLGTGRQDARLKVEGVDLGELLRLADIEGLSGAGRLNGAIPVSIVGDAIIVSNGVLEAESPGPLRYAPTRAPDALQAGGESVSLALEALSNFRYTSLRLTLDRDASGETTLVMRLKGSNPDFYDGYPVELNLNVSGKLDQAIRQSLVGYRVPDAIADMLADFPDP